MFKLNDILTPKLKAQLAIEYLQNQVANIRAGLVITRPYAKFTIKRRKTFGLPTSHVDLTGNSAYSNHSWRLLDQWKIKIIKDRPEVDVYFKNTEAARIFGLQKIRYGNVFLSK
jgi:hypothetical protein